MHHEARNLFQLHPSDEPGNLLEQFVKTMQDFFAQHDILECQAVDAMCFVVYSSIEGAEIESLHLFDPGRCRAAHIDVDVEITLLMLAGSASIELERSDQQHPARNIRRRIQVVAQVTERLLFEASPKSRSTREECDGALP